MWQLAYLYEFLGPSWQARHIETVVGSTMNLKNLNWELAIIDGRHLIHCMYKSACWSILHTEFINAQEEKQEKDKLNNTCILLTVYHTYQDWDSAGFFFFIHRHIQSFLLYAMVVPGILSMNAWVVVVRSFKGFKYWLIEGFALVTAIWW